MNKHYVLMADIINSSGKPAGRLMSHFKEITNKINSAYSDEIVSPLTITLGDEFQGLLKTLPAAVKIIIEFDKMLLDAPVDYSLRYSVYYGEVATAINKERAHEMLGPALTEAREQLEKMKHRNEEVFFHGMDQAINLNLAFILYRSIYNSWSCKEKKIVYNFLEKHDYKIVAKIFKRDASSMWRKEKSLRLKEFKTACELINLLAE